MNRSFILLFITVMALSRVRGESLTGPGVMSLEENGIPSFAKEGWTRPKEEAAKHPLKGADGVVVSSNRLFIPNGFDNRWLETTTPSAPAKERGHFLYAQPPLLREGGDSVFLHYPFSAGWKTAAASRVENAIQDARQIVEEVQRRTNSGSQRYEGTIQVIDLRNKIAEKRWVFDRLGSHGSSKSILRFTAPAEVKGVALLIVNHPERSSDQWMWTPALARDRRIALQDRSTRFFGTDFSFEDLEERDTNQFEYRLLGVEQYDGATCWKIEARPRQAKVSQYTHSYLWVTQDNYLLVQIENYKQTELVRRAKYRDVRNVQGFWTAHTIEMADVKRQSRTILKLEKLQYNLPMKDADFTLQALRRES